MKLYSLLKSRTGICCQLFCLSLLLLLIFDNHESFYRFIEPDAPFPQGARLFENDPAALAGVLRVLDGALQAIDDPDRIGWRLVLPVEFV